MENLLTGEFRRAIVQLTDSCHSVLRILDQSSALKLPSQDQKQISKTSQKEATPLLVIEDHVFTIRFRGKPCFLGNSLGYRLILKLAENRGRYVSHEELLETIWCGKRSVSAIKSVISDLRHKLLKSGLTELARALDGSLKGHYRLRIARD
ncbi:MAG: helix-turn-helix domain-containing protein [Pirellulales bacterium]